MMTAVTSAAGVEISCARIHSPFLDIDKLSDMLRLLPHVREYTNSLWASLLPRQQLRSLSVEIAKCEKQLPVWWIALRYLPWSTSIYYIYLKVEVNLPSSFHVLRHTSCEQGVIQWHKTLHMLCLLSLDATMLTWCVTPSRKTTCTSILYSYWTD